MVYLSSSPDKLCLQSFTIILTRHSMFELQHKPPMFAPPLPPGHHHNQMPLSSSEIMAIPTWPSGYSFLYEKKNVLTLNPAQALGRRGGGLVCITKCTCLVCSGDSTTHASRLGFLNSHMTIPILQHVTKHTKSWFHLCV